MALVEFADYECPFCARHTREVSPQIKREFIDSGAIEHVVFSFPLESIHANAFRASEAAECAGAQGRFWEMHERLFDSSGALDHAGLMQHARRLELDQEQFEHCLSGQAAANVRADIEQGRRLGVRSTPVFFIGIVEGDGSVRLTRRIKGAMPVETFREEISAALTRPLRTGRWWRLG